MKRLLPLAIFLLVSFCSLAQQDPLYSQYFNNPMLINPAFAGSNERLYAGLAYRSQWANLPGAPVTFNFNSHMSVADNKVGVGVLAVQDKLGNIKNTQYGTAFSYRIKLQNSTFSFGMQAGFTRYTTDQDGLKVFNQPDPAFASFNTTKFNTGVGVLLQSERYTIGLSVPRMLSSDITQGGQRVQVYSQNYYLYGAYIFNLTERIQFKPSALFRATKGTSVSTDINANFIFNQLYTAGLFTRQFNTYGVLLQAALKNYRLGYVFEIPGKGSALNYETNEISLAVSLDVLQSHNHSRTGF